MRSVAAISTGTQSAQGYTPNFVPPSQTYCPVCGNGIVESTETCDDGNLAPGDGCLEAALRCHHELDIRRLVASGPAEGAAIKPATTAP